MRVTDVRILPFGSFFTFFFFLIDVDRVGGGLYRGLGSGFLFFFC